MLSRLRLLLMVCMAVALPVQGMAAVTMTHCGPGHRGSAGSLTASSSIAQQTTEHHSVQPSASDHHHSSALSAPETANPGGSVDGDAASAPSAKPATPFKNSCSACAYCCLGAGMTAPQPALPSASSGSDALVVTDEAAPPGITVGGLERPPRLTFA